MLDAFLLLLEVLQHTDTVAMTRRTSRHVIRHTTRQLHVREQQ